MLSEHEVRKLLDKTLQRNAEAAKLIKMLCDQHLKEAPTCGCALYSEARYWLDKANTQPQPEQRK